jgi:hypothetical protein
LLPIDFVLFLSTGSSSIAGIHILHQGDDAAVEAWGRFDVPLFGQKRGISLDGNLIDVLCNWDQARRCHAVWGAPRLWLAVGSRRSPGPGRLSRAGPSLWWKVVLRAQCRCWGPHLRRRNHSCCPRPPPTSRGSAASRADPPSFPPSRANCSMFERRLSRSWDSHWGDLIGHVCFAIMKYLFPRMIHLEEESGQIPLLA